MQHQADLKSYAGTFKGFGEIGRNSTTSYREPVFSASVFNNINPVGNNLNLPFDMFVPLLDDKKMK